MKPLIDEKFTDHHFVVEDIDIQPEQKQQAETEKVSAISSCDLESPTEWKS